jgi:hypothetical protein
VLTLGLVLGNAALQSRIAQANAERIIRVAEEYRAAVGTYPAKLADLTPRYLPSVPRAKYTLGPFGDFWYISTTPSDPHRAIVARVASDRHVLMWVALPPFGRRVYVFEEARWGSLD